MEIDNQKLQQIYSTAKSMFIRYGFKRVSIEEICREASVSKMTFYKFFSNKFDLLKFILEKMTADSLAAYREILEQDTRLIVSFRQSAKHRLSLPQALGG
jgi:AcrR family transcriptional regulator